MNILLEYEEQPLVAKWLLFGASLAARLLATTSSKQISKQTHFTLPYLTSSHLLLFAQQNSLIFIPQKMRELLYFRVKNLAECCFNSDNLDIFLPLSLNRSVDFSKTSQQR